MADTPFNGRLRRVVVGLDGSEGSERALGVVVDLATACGAEVVAVHAVEPRVHTAALGGLEAARLPTEVAEEWYGRLREDLDGRWSQPLRDAGLRCRTLLVDGDPAGVLIDVARREHADLVVTGTRGRGGFAEAMLGSVSHHLTHHSPVPVLVVPDPGR